MKVTARESDDSVVVSVGDLHAKRPISDLVVKLEGNRIRVWGVNRTTHSWSLYVESTILSSTKSANGSSGRNTESIPTLSPDISTDTPAIT
jgi:hypothetical protein